MDKLRQEVEALFAVAMTGGQYGKPRQFADLVLALPEIAEARDALAERRLNAMSPGAFGAMLLDNLPPKG